MYSTWLGMIEIQKLYYNQMLLPMYWNDYNWKQKQNNDNSLILKLSHIACGSVNWYNPLEIGFTISTKVKCLHTIWPALPLPSIYPKEWPPCIHEKIYRDG